MKRPVRPVVVLAAGALVGGVALAAWLILGPPARVIPVVPGARLLALSRGTLYWLGPTCSIWRARVEGTRIPEPSEPLLSLGECPPDDPRVDGDFVYRLGGMGIVERVSHDRRRSVVQRSFAFALALDDRYLYVGNCALRDDCRIERVPTNGTDEPTVMQAGIVALANMDVDGSEIFWVDRGQRRPKQVAPRLMAAAKDEPRALERVVLADFDGRRPFLGAHHVYWLGAGGVRRVPKAGGSNELVLAAKTLSGFASDGDEVFVATDAGVFRARDGEAIRSLRRTSSAPRGLAVDAHAVYWIDADDNAVVRHIR